MKNHNKRFLIFTVIFNLFCLSACSNSIESNNFSAEVTDNTNISSKSDTTENDVISTDISDAESTAEPTPIPSNNDSEYKTIPSDTETEVSDHRTVEPGLYTAEAYYDFGDGNPFTVYEYYELYEDGTGIWNIQDNGTCTWDDIYIDHYTYNYDGNTLTLINGNEYEYTYDKHTNSIIKPMDSSLTSTNIPDGDYSIVLHAKDIKNINGSIFLEATICEAEQFDINAIDNLKVGDAVFTDEYNLSIVEYIEKDDKTVRINGRDEYEGSLITFTKDDNNNYYLATAEYYNTDVPNTQHCTSPISLPLSDSFTFEYYDYSSDNATIVNTDDFIKIINDSSYSNYLTATIQNGTIVKATKE